jgi:hypothetical protein
LAMWSPSRGGCCRISRTPSPGHKIRFVIVSLILFIYLFIYLNPLFMPLMCNYQTANYSFLHKKLACWRYAFLFPFLWKLFGKKDLASMLRFSLFSVQIC